MPTAYITHSECLRHDAGENHPECPARITAIEKHLISSGLMELLEIYEAPVASNEQLLRVHAEGYIDSIEFAIPEHGIVQLDSDTTLNPFTYKAAIRAAGSVVKGVDLVMAGKVDRGGKPAIHQIYKN